MKFFINIPALKFILHFLSMFEMSPAKSHIELPIAKQVFKEVSQKEGNQRFSKLKGP